MLSQQLLILVAGVLAAAVRVVQKSARRPPMLERHRKGVQCEPVFPAFAERPPDYPAREQIPDYRQVQPAFQASEIGNVGDPAGVGHEHCKAARQQITLYCHSVFGIGGAAKAAALTPAQSRRTHQPRHWLARDTLSAFVQLHLHPRTAIAAGLSAWIAATSSTRLWS